MGGRVRGPAGQTLTGVPRGTRPTWTVTATVLLHRGGRWLLTVRGADVDDAAGQLGLVGGHVEHPTPGRDVLEATARREAYEETGIDLDGVGLTYLESELFTTDAGVGQVTVAFLAPAPPGVQPTVADPAELSEVGWWSPEEAGADPRCPPWLPGLLERATARLDLASLA